jgi:hypothetical protein
MKGMNKSNSPSISLVMRSTRASRSCARSIQFSTRGAPHLGRFSSSHFDTPCAMRRNAGAEVLSQRSRETGIASSRAYSAFIHLLPPARLRYQRRRYRPSSSTARFMVSGFESDEPS